MSEKEKQEKEQEKKVEITGHDLFRIARSYKHLQECKHKHFAECLEYICKELGI